VQLISNQFKISIDKKLNANGLFDLTLPFTKGSRKNNFTFLHLSFSPSLADTSLAPDLIKLAAK
jgi:hypothetical protein